MSASRSAGKKRAHQPAEEDNGPDIHSDDGSEAQTQDPVRGLTQQELLDSQVEDDLNTPEAREKQKFTKSQYRIHYQNALDFAEDHESFTRDTFKGHMEAIGESFENVKNPAIATQDASVLKVMSEAINNKVRHMKTDVQNFDTNEFITHFIKLLGKRAFPNEEDDDGAGSIDWEKAGQRVMKYSRRAPTMDLMYGPLSIETKQRKLTKRTRVEKDETQRKAPTNIETDALQEGAAKEMEKMIKDLRGILNKVTQKAEGDLNFFEFFINPKSYSQTVENLFCLSFLIKDGFAGIETEDEDGNLLDFPIVFATEVANIRDRQEGARKKQVIMELTMKDWEDAIELYNIRESIIPDRGNT